MRWRTLITTCCLALAAAAPSQATVRTGIAEQDAGVFTSPLFGAAELLDARYVVPWDVMQSATQTAQVGAWLDAATASRTRTLVAFNASSRAGRATFAPSPTEYGRAIGAFIARFGDRVDAYVPWTAVNDCLRRPARLCARVDGPRLAAQYYLQLKRRVRGRPVVALDLMDTDYRRAAAYLRRFVVHARTAKPRLFGLRNFSDANRKSTDYTRYIIGHGLPRGARLWLTATGGVAQYGSFAYDLERQATAVRRVFAIAARHPAITRVYLDRWFGTTNADAPQPNGHGRPFDSGLIAPDGTPRPAYQALLER